MSSAEALVRSAKAEALREAAADIKRQSLGFKAMVTRQSSDLADVASWLSTRAEKIEAGVL